MGGELGHLQEKHNKTCLRGNLVQFHPDKPELVVHCNCKKWPPVTQAAAVDAYTHISRPKLAMLPHVPLDSTSSQPHIATVKVENNSIVTSFPKSLSQVGHRPFHHLGSQYHRYWLAECTSAASADRIDKWLVDMDWVGPPTRVA
mmetsp:Transcript_29879/g.49473  ORF Transcript_29879/g.49473 Transcript_29879/m.49473 type:complete len:145 (+) Transcript_29879:108-542(+)